MSALRLKPNVSINLCFYLSFLKHVSSLTVGAFGCYSMLTMLNIISAYSKNEIDKCIVKVHRAGHFSDSQYCKLRVKYVTYKKYCSL